MLRISDLDEAVQIFLNPPRHGELMDTCLQLPEWFDLSLDADSKAFRDQQIQFWREITKRTEYDPFADEDTPEVGALDAIYRPAFYSTGNAYEAGLHLLAMGHILLRSGIREGDRVLECGAGFGQNALAFARLGAKVDTIDVGAGFCSMFRQSAERYNVDLTPHQVPFGSNPAGEDGAYDLILFYESFHHCLDFKDVIPKLRDMLKPGGRIMLAGEPISTGPEENMPYPWGIRLHWTNVAVMRQRGWMELGFQQSYLIRQFANAGLSWRLYPDPNAETAQVYEFKRWDAPLELSSCGLTRTEEATWHGAEPNGRWTTSRTVLGIPSRDGRFSVDIVNLHPVARRGHITMGEQSVHFELSSGERASLEFSQRASDHNQQIIIHSNVETGSPVDGRQLGIFVERVSPK